MILVRHIAKKNELYSTLLKDGSTEIGIISQNSRIKDLEECNSRGNVDCCFLELSSEDGSNDATADLTPQET